MPSSLEAASPCAREDPLGANMRETTAGAQGPSGFKITLDHGVKVDVRAGVAVNVAPTKPGVVVTIVCSSEATVVQGNGLNVSAGAIGAAADGAAIAGAQGPSGFTTVCSTRGTAVQGHGVVVFVGASGAAARGATIAQGGGVSTQHLSLLHFPF